MRDFYAVLRLKPRASEAEIKAAFRNLAKTCHPDVRPGDSAAEETFQEAKRAYRFLSNPETRKIYDAFLADRRAAKRVRLRHLATTMSATFLLTAATVLLAVGWLNEQGGLPFAGWSVLADVPAHGAQVEQVEMARGPAVGANAEDAADGRTDGAGKRGRAPTSSAQ